jgi:hypothetical protein
LLFWLDGTPQAIIARIRTDDAAKTEILLFIFLHDHLQSLIENNKPIYQTTDYVSGGLIPDAF